ncbi:MAG: VanZ family protein [Cyanobacteria bacterium SBLK]|nr:VanZ family protein [Cyanobacteria bacterium SBLK]
MKARHPGNFPWILAACFYGALLFTIGFLAYTGNLPAFLHYIPYHDTLGHFILYGIASYLGDRVLRGRKFPVMGYRIPLFAFVFGVITIVEEYIQSFSPHRTFSWVDMIASLLGLLVGYWLAQRELKTGKMRDKAIKNGQDARQSH